MIRMNSMISIYFYDVPFPDISSGFSNLSQHFRQMFLKRFGCRLQHEITPAFLSLSPHFHFFPRHFFWVDLGPGWARGFTTFTTGANASPRSSMTTAMALLNSMSSEAKPFHAMAGWQGKPAVMSLCSSTYTNMTNMTCILLIIVIHVCIYIYNNYTLY